MKKIGLLVGLFLIVALLAVSCARTSSKSAEPSVRTTLPAPSPPQSAAVFRDAVEGSSKGSSVSSAGEKMIVRNGDISLVVKDVVTARDEIARLVVGLGGYVVSSWIGGEGKEMMGSISIRVPDEKFESTLIELRRLAVRADSESTNSRDVTEEYIDLGARLKNAEATERQYLALLDKAKNVEDTLKIYDSLSRVRREIEQIKGQMQYLERTAAMSSITVQLRPLASAEPLVPVSWSALEVLRSAIRGMVTFGQWLLTGAIWLVVLLPVWGIGVAIFLWRRRRKSRK